MAGDITGKSGTAAAADGSGARLHKQKILHHCRQHGEQFASLLFKQVMDKLDSALSERGTRAGADAQHLIDAARDLRVKRQELFGVFFDRFTELFTSRLKLATAVASGRNAQGEGLSLSLVDEQDLEESLAVDGLVTKANDCFRNELFALAQRFNQLIDGAQYKEETVPLSPDVFAHAFRDALHSLTWKLEIKLIVFKLFEQVALRELGDFYHQCNGLLGKEGILPQLRAAVAIRTAVHAMGGRTAPPAAASRAEGPVGDVTSRGVTCSRPTGTSGENRDGVSAEAVASDIYQTLQRLMNLRKYGAASNEGVPSMAGGEERSAAIAGLALLPADDVVRALSLLQHDSVPAVATAGTAGAGLIKGALLDQMRQLGDGRGLHPAHDNTIDVIGMIFEFILDEPSIPDLVKNLLKRLQIPILKVAIVDKGFFTNKTNPARRLLNVLGHASIGWNENSENVRRRRFEKMEYVVNRVIADFEQDPGVLAELLADFTGFLNGEGAEVGQEALPTAEGQTKAEPAPDRLAFETVESCLEDAEVPEVLRRFLRTTWREVLQQALDQEGSAGAAWRRRCQALADLMWSIAPKTTIEDRRKMVMLLPRLLDELRDGMSRIGRGPPEIDAALDVLEPIHMTCLRGEQPPLKPVPAAAGASSSGEVADMIRAIQQDMSGNDEALLHAAAEHDDTAPVEEAALPGEEPEDEFTAMAADMQLGSWLEFAFEDKKRRAKLAWKSAVMGEYVFVDRKYKVVAERTLSSLAADLRHGRATRVEDVAMFDRALDKVLNGLMSGGKSAH